MNKQEIKKALSQGKIVRTNFCSVEKLGIPCAEVIEKEFNAEVRGTLGNKKETPKGKCAICNKSLSRAQIRNGDRICMTCSFFDKTLLYMGRVLNERARRGTRLNIRWEVESVSSDDTERGCVI